MLIAVLAAIVAGLVFDGSVRFGDKREANGQLQTDQNLHVGDELFFNYYVNPTGPNPVSEDGAARAVILEPDSSPKSENEAIEHFKDEIKKERKDHPVKPIWTILMPQDKGHFDTARAFTEDRNREVITQPLLDELRAGTKVAYVLVEISYY
jgi:hypothetical protein